MSFDNKLGEQDNICGSLNGREVHFRPRSVNNANYKKITITRDQLESVSSTGTTLLDEQEQIEDAKKDRKPVKLANGNKTIYTPDTTVLDFDGYVFNEEDNNEPKLTIDGRVPVKVPTKKVKETYNKKTNVSKDKKLKRVSKPIKKLTKSLKKINRADIIDEEPASNLDTTLLDEKVKDNETAKSSKPKKITDKSTKLKNISFKLIRLSNQENISISGDKFVVGKSKHSDYQVKGNNTVSRSHAFFSVDHNKLFIEDNDSKNGTCIDGTYVNAHDKTELKDGQTIRLSDEVFRVQIKG